MCTEFDQQFGIHIRHNSEVEGLAHLLELPRALARAILRQRQVADVPAVAKRGEGLWLPAIGHTEIVIESLGLRRLGIGEVAAGPGLAGFLEKSCGADDQLSCKVRAELDHEKACQPIFRIVESSPDRNVQQVVNRRGSLVKDGLNGGPSEHEVSRLGCDIGGNSLDPVDQIVANRHGTARSVRSGRRAAFVELDDKLFGKSQRHQELTELLKLLKLLDPVGDALETCAVSRQINELHLRIGERLRLSLLASKFGCDQRRQDYEKKKRAPHMPHS